ncbi:hypothetical protein [Rhodococcus zopfii]|uniref:hypothetical protein n=1 Tax=Rhodococcus zopfii TaxID=43772 RepID=UPI0035275447
MNAGELPRPPYPADLLADLHAGVLADDVAERLWPLVRSDADAMAVIVALDGVQERLRDLAHRDAPGTGSMPPEVAMRLDDAVLGDVRARRRRRRVFAGAVVGAAAAVVAVVAVVVVGVIGPSSDETAPIAVGPSGAAVLEPDSLRSLIGSTDLGPLSDDRALTGCLTANGIDPAGPLLGSTTLEYGDRDAVLLLVPGDLPPQLTAIVVGTGCDATHPETLSVTTIG